LLLLGRDDGKTLLGQPYPDAAEAGCIPVPEHIGERGGNIQDGLLLHEQQRRVALA
jgi:hypothetical protein